MAARRRKPRSDSRTRAVAARPANGVGDVVRRAPFADNPHVGARGQRTQQRILDAALLAFGAEGYDACGVDSIAKRAGCSRAAFYQYFSSKEDVFRHLTGEAARQLNASTEALEPLAADAAGWRALRAWVSRHSAIHHRYEPLFHAFPAASESDDAVAIGGRRWVERTVARIRARITATALRPRDLDPVIEQLIECVARTHDVTRILRSSAAGHYGEERVDDALTDVMYRSLFGVVHDPDVERAARPALPEIPFERAIRELPRAAAADPVGAGRQTREALLDAGRMVFAARGYHGTRVGDVAEAAGVSRAWFYRYFQNKDELARTLTTRAMQMVSRVLGEFPAGAAQGGAAGRAALRRWLRRYNVTQAHEAAMLRVWVDAALQDAALRSDSAAALDWGRRALVAFVAPRGFGDFEMDSVVLLSLLSAFGARERAASEIDAAAHVIEQGILGVASR